MTHASARPARWKILLAFAIIYFVWGSTYLAIRVGVLEMPPFLMAGIRFTIAGLAVWIWMRIRGTPSLTWREWRAAALLGALMFLLYYACLFWAEQRVPSGIAAVIIAIIPAYHRSEIIFLRTQHLTTRLVRSRRRRAWSCGAREPVVSSGVRHRRSGRAIVCWSRGMVDKRWSAAESHYQLPR